jgi:Protein of unknown function (DUF3810)
MTRRAGWTIVFALAAAAALGPIPAAAVERLYSDAVYPPVQRALTTLSNLAPFALFDALWIGAIAVCVIVVRRYVIAHGWLKGGLRVLIPLSKATAVVYLAFLAMWGLNYRRVPMVEKVKFEPQRVTSQANLALAMWAVGELNADYAAAHAAPVPPDALRGWFDEALRVLGRPSIVVGRPKQTLLGWYFHQAAIAGMTDPFLLETLLSPDLFEIERPFVIAHEWAHLAGYADESEANFVAYLTCRRGTAAARYSAALVIFAYTTPDVLSPKHGLDLGPRTDLFSMQRRYANTSVSLRFAAKEGYDQYLKANRVERGIESYDAVVQLILGTEYDAQGNPILK